jgi:glutaminyl-peptide cyclotransferase
MNRNRILLALLALFAGAMIYVTLFKSKKAADDPIVNNPPPPAIPELKMTSTGTTVPHNAQVFTEGLEFYKGKMLESAGSYGKSALIRYDVTTGKEEMRTPLDAAYFGEGLTQLNGKIYQLTYKEGKGFIYDAATFKKLGEFKWPHGEGWGMTNDGQSIIANTGGSTLFFINPADFSVVKTLNVTAQGMPVSNVNEMEYVNGFIYANIWMTDIIIKIDAKTGQVVAQRSLKGILPNFDVESVAAREDSAFLNGIAYRPETQTFFVTGKMWPKMFEVKFE